MMLAVDFTPLAEIIRRNAVQPKVLAIAPDIGVGHPLVRQVGGQWAQRVSCLWITDEAEWLLKTEKSPAVAARLERYASRDHLEDIRGNGLILFCWIWIGRRARTRTRLSELLKAYSEISREQGSLF